MKCRLWQIAAGVPFPERYPFGMVQNPAEQRLWLAVYIAACLRFTLSL
jgi:hypothetical protein